MAAIQKDQNQRKVLKANQKLYEANLEHFGPEMAKLLEESQETPVPVEDVIISGLKNPTCLVIIGFSGMATLEAAKRVKKDIKQIVIIEPSLSVFKQTLKRWYIGTLSDQPNVDLIVGVAPEQLGPQLQAIFTMSDEKGNRIGRCLYPEIIFDPFVYLNENGEQTEIGKRLVDIVKTISKQVLLSMGCASDSFFRWEQAFRNEKNIQDCYRIGALFGQFQDLPAVVLGAGPSLSEFIDAYHEHKLENRCLIIACDASLRRLLDAGIRPHLVTRTERKFTPIFRGVEKKDTKGLFYVAYPWCDPAFFDLFDRSFMMYRSNGVCKFTEPFSHGFVDGGVSSANAALEIAFNLGCKQIFLSGIDLCFLDGKSHAEGTQVEFDPENSKSKWTKLRANNGEEVTTIPVWTRCLEEYQGAIYKRGGAAYEIFNTSHRGAAIFGAKYVPWAEAGDRILSAKTINTKTPLQRLESKLDKHTRSYGKTYQEKKKDLSKLLGEFCGEFEKLKLSVHDHMLIGRREEERALEHLKTFSDPDEFNRHVAIMNKQLANVYSKPANEIDRFKRRFYTDKRFSQSITDICLVDYAQTDNRLLSLKNSVERDHERMRMYVGLQMGVLSTLNFYSAKLKETIDQGVDHSVQLYDKHPAEGAKA